MQCTITARKVLWLSIFLMGATSYSEEVDQQLQLDEASDAVYNYFGRFDSNEPLTGYGTGGYGDATTADFNLRVCSSKEETGINCTADDPDAGYMEWRFIKHLGWRKFSRYGTARKDWWDYKKTLRWPFGRYQTFGYNRWDW